MKLLWTQAFNINSEIAAEFIHSFVSLETETLSDVPPEKGVPALIIVQQMRQKRLPCVLGPGALSVSQGLCHS